LLSFVYLSMLLQRFYSLIFSNPGVLIAYNKYMSIYSGKPAFKITLYAVCIGYTKSVASISNHVKMGSATCLFWLPFLENRGSQNSSEQSCDCLLFHAISVSKIRSTPNSKWSCLLTTPTFE
jgi:hypothetical protein